MKLRIVLAAAVLALAAAPAASAARWTRVTAPGGQNTDEVAAARTADGVLHVVWLRRSGPSSEDLMHTAIAAGGKVGATTPIVTGWAALSNPAVTVVPGGLRAVWGGIRSIDPSETNDDLNTALSTDGGATWALQPGSIAAPGTAAYAAPAAAATLPGGTLLAAWAGSTGTWVHSGLDPATPDFDYQTPLGDFGYDPGIAADGTGAAMLAWYSNATGHLGVFAQAVGPSGAPGGSPLNMPGTADMQVGMLERTPIAARRGGGFYVAYPTGYPVMNRVRLWRVGASAAPVVARTKTDAHATVAADAKGRLWVAWSSGTRVLAARSNRAGSRFGAVVSAGAIKHAATLYKLDANATADGALDLLALYFAGTQSSGATYHARVEPGLTLHAARRHGTVAFTVTDAGDPVRGARVSARGRSGRTDRRGRVTLAFRGAAKAVASASGYESATLRVR